MTRPPNTEARIGRLRRLLRKSDADAILITNFTNVTYLTGFTGDDSYLLLHRDGVVLVTDSRYTLQLREECPGLELVVRRPGVTMTESLTKLIRKVKPARLAVEADSMTLSQFAAISGKLPRLQLITTSGLVERLRLVKDKYEIREIREAIAIAEWAIAQIRASLSAGKTEKEVADDIEHLSRRLGGRCCSFPPIVAVGPQSALPHATPGNRRLEKGQFVLIDWGVQGRLYVSDLTRVFSIGRISPKLERIYKVVLKAQRRAIESIKPKVKASDVDAVARSVIAEAGYGKHFGHGLGHGIGLKVHEAPRMAAGQDELLQAGMVVTVEPGIYLPGWGGVRIEDDVLVTRNGHEVLSSVPKDLVDCVVA